MSKEFNSNQPPFNRKMSFFLSNTKVKNDDLKENVVSQSTENNIVSTYLIDTRNFEDIVTEWNKHYNSAETEEIRKQLENLRNTLISHRPNDTSLSYTQVRGNALKKSNDFECISQPTCKYPQRGNCLGCEYQIDKNTNLLLDPQNKPD